MKIGSLFDGSGGFPLAATMCGIEPVWASEVEPYPIAVTKSRFPNMKHLGSVTDINGSEIEPVDIITFGSPCQDLSVAGKRAGLKHTENGDEETTRSGLFMEAIRIIKEMREATNGEYPRYAIWENVPGAFSSNRGLDFRVVLEELIRISEPTAVMPPVPKAGWAYSDVYCGNGWSLAYRVLDAQYWGVPQRRRRIYLVADFRGQRAGKILFEREGLRGHFETGRTPWQGTAGDAENCARADDRAEKCVTRLQFATYDARGNGDGAVVSTLTGDHENRITDYTSVIVEPAVKYAYWDGSQTCGTLTANNANGAQRMPDKDNFNCVIALDRAYFNQGQNALYDSQLYEDGTNPTLVARGPNAVAVRYIVRRLTPTECARLQGFPDKWGHPDAKDELTDEEYRFWLDVRNIHAEINGKAVKDYTKQQMLTWYNKLHTDSSEYKMWGNGIALPCALYVMQGIAEALYESRN